MIRYKYNRQFVPPVPLAHVMLCTPDGKRATNELPAQLDTAADRSVIPWSVVEKLGLVQADEIAVECFGGTVISVPTFVVHVRFRESPFVLAEVAASRSERLVLLGRDILNRYRLLLDGPQEKLEIG